MEYAYGRVSKYERIWNLSVFSSIFGSSSNQRHPEYFVNKNMPKEDTNAFFGFATFMSSKNLRIGPLLSLNSCSAQKNLPKHLVTYHMHEWKFKFLYQSNFSARCFIQSPSCNAHPDTILIYGFEVSFLLL